MREFAVVYEQGSTNWGAYVQDLRGCVAASESLVEVQELIRGAIEVNLETMREDGDPVPEPCSRAAMVSVAA